MGFEGKFGAGGDGCAREWAFSGNGLIWFNLTQRRKGGLGLYLRLIGNEPGGFGGWPDATFYRGRRADGGMAVSSGLIWFDLV